MKLDEIAEIGEESGREETEDRYPFLLPIPSRRILTQWGRGRAQGLYALRGKAARIFAQNWAMGYVANIAVWQRDGYLPDGESEKTVMGEKEDNLHEKLEAECSAAIAKASPHAVRRTCEGCGKMRWCRQRPSGLISKPLAWFCRSCQALG